MRRTRAWDARLRAQFQKPQSRSAKLFTQRVTQNRNRRNHRRLSPQNSFAKRSLEVSRLASRSNLRVRPTTLRPNRHRNRFAQTAHLHAAHGPRVLPLRKNKLASGPRICKRLFSRQHCGQNRRFQLPRLLRRFTQDFFPALRAFSRRRKQFLLAPRRGQRNNLRHAKLRGLFEAPLKAVKLDQRNQELDFKRRSRLLDRLDKRKFDRSAVPRRRRHGLDFSKPHALAITQFIKLPRLSSQHAPKMRRVLAV